MNYTNILKQKTTPQSKPIPGKETKMAKNNAGGYAFVISPLERLKRFLVLGSDSNTYYVGAKKLTHQNIDNIDAALKDTNYSTVVDLVAEYSFSGRVQRNDSCVLALARLWNTSTEIRRYIVESGAYNRVLRYSTDHFQFQKFVDLLGGTWNRTRRNAVNQWYNRYNVDELQYQIVKYQSREEWSHHDLCVVGHPTMNDQYKNAVIEYAVHGYTDLVQNYNNELNLISAYEAIKNAQTVKDVIKIIDHYSLTWEFVPSQWLGDVTVWRALLPNLPPNALVRNLSRLTANGLLKFGNVDCKYVMEKLNGYIDNPKSRLHPGQMLMSWGAYSSGKSPNLNWNPVQQIVDLLEDGFYRRFQTVTPSNRNFYIGLDVSGSMDHMMDNLGFNTRTASSALMLQFVKTEPYCYTSAFTDSMVHLPIGKNDSIRTVVQRTSNMRFGRTDCAQPMLDAISKSMNNIDVFMVLTDNETWAGDIHPVQALELYRKKYNPNAKLVVVGMTATEFSIADTNDFGMLDVVGFDAQAPELIQNFSKYGF